MEIENYLFYLSKIKQGRPLQSEGRTQVLGLPDAGAAQCWRAMLKGGAEPGPRGRGQALRINTTALAHRASTPLCFRTRSGTAQLRRNTSAPSFSRRTVLQPPGAEAARCWRAVLKDGGEVRR